METCLTYILKKGIRKYFSDRFYYLYNNHYSKLIEYFGDIFKYGESYYSEFERNINTWSENKIIDFYRDFKPALNKIIFDLEELNYLIYGVQNIHKFKNYRRWFGQQNKDYLLLYIVRKYIESEYNDYSEFVKNFKNKIPLSYINRYYDVQYICKIVDGELIYIPTSSKKSVTRMLYRFSSKINSLNKRHNYPVSNHKKVNIF